MTTPQLHGTYRQIDPADVPAGIRWDVPPRNQGQIVEVAYAAFGRTPEDWGAEYQRTTDRADGSVVYARYVPDESGLPPITWHKSPRR